MKKLNLVSLFIWSLLGQPAFSDTERYNGLCEASAAEWIGGSRFAVASDDLDKFNGDEKDSLAVYELGILDPVAWTDDLGKLTDIEASTQFDAYQFWLTSHSRADQAKRNRLFATEIVDGVPHEVGSKFKDLREIINAALPNFTTDYIASHLNIEGLSHTSDGTLILGLRAPLTEGNEAIIIDIGSPFEKLDIPNPSQHVASDEVSVRTLWLGGRGIRSIERLNDDLGYLIIAGASSSEEAGFALYYWDGEEAIAEIPSVNFGEMNPEAMMIWPNGSVQILGDNGGENCSDNPDQGNTNASWFPSMSFDSSELVPNLHSPNWSCSNDEMEVACGENGCIASSNQDFTPMDVSFDNSFVRFCAYTECWQGPSETIEDEKILYTFSHELLGQNDPTRPPLTLQLALDKSTNIAVLNALSYVNPMNCGIVQ